MAAPLEQLRLHTATREDASRIAEIHMAAFGPNAMLHAQFPTPIIRQELQKCIEKKALADIDDSKTTVLVVTGSKGECLPLLKGHAPVFFWEEMVTSKGTHSRIHSCDKKKINS